MKAHQFEINLPPKLTADVLNDQLDRLRAEDAVLKQKAKLAFIAYDDAVKAGDDETVRVARDRFMSGSIALRQSANAIARVAAREGRP